MTVSLLGNVNNGWTVFFLLLPKPPRSLTYTHIVLVTHPWENEGLILQGQRQGQSRDNWYAEQE